MNYRYYIPTAVLFVVFASYLIMGALWHMSHPMIMDYFYNSTLQMWEPVYFDPFATEGGIGLVWSFIYGVFKTWWLLPMWLFVLSILFVIWCGILILAARPCIVAKGEAK